MPKAVEKPAPKATPSANTKAAAEKAKATDKANQEREKAQRMRVIESQVAPIAKSLSAVAAAESKVTAGYLDTIRVIRDIVKDNDFTKEETQKLLTAALAKVYTDGDVDQVSSKSDTREGRTAYSNRSKFISILFPKDAKKQKAVDKALDTNSADFNTLYGLSTGLIDPSKAKQKGQHGGARQQASKWITDEETAKNELSAIVAKMWNGDGVIEKYEGGFDLDDIERILQEVHADYIAEKDAAEAEEK